MQIIVPVWLGSKWAQGLCADDFACVFDYLLVILLKGSKVCFYYINISRWAQGLCADDFACVFDYVLVILLKGSKVWLSTRAREKLPYSSYFKWLKQKPEEWLIPLEWMGLHLKRKENSEQPFSRFTSMLVNVFIPLIFQGINLNWSIINAVVQP